MSRPTPDAAPTLEARLRRIEEIVAQMERRDLELDEALRLFEEGVQHMREAKSALRQAELRIERLIEDASGDVSAEPATGDAG